MESLGYSLILAINAISIWGGIYPFLPQSYSVPQTTVIFYMVQMAACLLTFLAAFFSSWKLSRLFKKPMVLFASFCLCAGPLILITSMYFEGLTSAFIIVSGVLIGMGSACFFIEWQKVFAAIEASFANLEIIKGTAYCTIIYFLICLIPAALAAYVIPLVMVPLAGLCLWLASEKTDHGQPMFDDEPYQHKAIYKKAVKENAILAIGVGALGFCSGSIRLMAVTHESLLSTINISSMSALLVIVTVFYFVWRAHSIQFGLNQASIILTIITATCLVVLPFAGSGATSICSAIAYASFMLAYLLVMMHCCQISRDGGINPIFIYGFYGSVIYMMQMIGYLTGYGSGSAQMLGLKELSFVGLIALYILFLVTMIGKSRTSTSMHRLEFLMLSPRQSAKETTEEVLAAYNVRKHEALAERFGDSSAHDSAEADSGHFTDKLSKKCLVISELYGLTAREAEVMELIARGNSGPQISKMLFISENTMRTHNKRIYMKLGIHKKQELLELLDKI
ncbi:MAG: LuxR C-terminal-related transcriptional regulator [Eggerthellaceae bacterium]|nr:LuxR C-terminal-related transcriptional regulator [Eggerthellaceae bacterium]